MDMSWQALLQEAAATSFEKTADTLAAAENDNCACIDLHQQQIHELKQENLVAAPSGARPAVEQILFPLIPGGDSKCFSIWKIPRGAFVSTKNCYLQVWTLRQVT